MRVTDAKGMNLLTKTRISSRYWISEGLPNREISLKMGISEHTVSNYLFRIFNKLGVSNRLELALYAIKQRHDGESKSKQNSFLIDDQFSDDLEPSPTSKAGLRKCAAVTA